MNRGGFRRRIDHVKNRKFAEFVPIFKNIPRFWKRFEIFTLWIHNWSKSYPGELPELNLHHNCKQEIHNFVWIVRHLTKWVIYQVMRYWGNYDWISELTSRILRKTFDVNPKVLWVTNPGSNFLFHSFSSWMAEKRFSRSQMKEFTKCLFCL